MIITYYGISCFKVVSGETTIVFDLPNKGSSVKTPRFHSDIVLVSHNHKDNNGGKENGSDADKKSVLVDGPGEYESRGVYIHGIPAFHDKEGGKERGLNTIYNVRFEGINLCHMGDFGEDKIRDEVKEAIGKVDILFIPIGGGEVITPEKAAKITTDLEPEIVIPMCYDGGNSKELKKFVSELGGNGKPIDKLNLKKKDLEGKETQIMILKEV